MSDKADQSPADQSSTTVESTAPSAVPSPTQLAWLCRGIDQPGGKLPLFDSIGQKVSEKTVRSCIRHGWAEPWFNNPIKPDWLICRLTESGRQIAQKYDHPLR